MSATVLTLVTLLAAPASSSGLKDPFAARPSDGTDLKDPWAEPHGAPGELRDPFHTHHEAVVEEDDEEGAVATRMPTASEARMPELKDPWARPHTVLPRPTHPSTTTWSGLLDPFTPRTSSSDLRDPWAPRPPVQRPRRSAPGQ